VDSDVTSWSLASIKDSGPEFESSVTRLELPKSSSGFNRYIGPQLRSRGSLLIGAAQDQSKCDDSLQYSGKRCNQRIVRVSEPLGATNERQTDDDSGLYFILAMLAAWTVGGLTYAVLKRR
jgi:hypothetical protein